MTYVTPIAILVDSSAALAGQWQFILKEYVQHMFSRLVANQAQVQVAFVTYAFADTTPSPIVAKRYFSSLSQASKDFAAEPWKLGLGSTSTGGSAGMAVLEGYAAALEMFDLFNRNVFSGNKENIADKPSAEEHPQNQHSYHIIHICAGSPDAAIHPYHNQLTDLDGLTWKTLPEELRKRNINLNILILKQIQALAELHTSTVTEPCKPWFSVRQDHMVLLSTQPSWALLHHPKRKDEQAPESADTKRARISSPKLPQSSPTQSTQPKPSQPLEPKPLPNAAGPSSQSQPQPQSQPRPQPTSQLVQASATNAPAAGPSQSGPSLQMGQQSLRVIEEQLRKQAVFINSLIEQGHLAQAEMLKRQLQPKIEVFKKLRDKILEQAKAAKNAASSGPGGSAPPKGEGSTSASTATATATPTQPQAPAPSDTQSLAQFVQSRQQTQTSPVSKPVANVPGPNPSAGNAAPRPTPPSFPAQLPVGLATQMQKLTSKEGIPGQNQMPSIKTPIQAQAHPGGRPLPPPAQASASSSTADRQCWNGVITWVGRENNDYPMVKMEAHVVAMGAPAAQQGNMANIRPELWPSVLDLRPSNEPVVSTQELKNWISLHKPAICSIQRGSENEDNANRFRSFCRLLNERQIYAIGSWPLPGTNNPRPTILIFSAGTAESAAGLVFPETGLPDIPKSGNRIPSSVITPANAPAFLQKLMNTPGMSAHVRQMAALPPEQQAIALQRLLSFTADRQKQQQALLMQRQQQLQQQAQNGNPALAAARGNNPMGGANFPGGGAWGGQPNQPQQSNIGQGFNFGLNSNGNNNNNNMGGMPMPNLGYGGINMSQSAQMQPPNGMNANVQNMNLMNMNNMNANAGMQLGTLGGMAGNPMPGAMQQQQQLGQTGNQILTDSVQAFLQRNGLSGGGGVR